MARDVKCSFAPATGEPRENEHHTNDKATLCGVTLLRHAGLLAAAPSHACSSTAQRLNGAGNTGRKMPRQV